MKREKTAYEVLGVAPDADDDVVRAAYRALAKKYHPDLKAPPGALTMAAINDAYARIETPAKRAQYDAELRAARKTGAGAAIGGAGVSKVVEHATQMVLSTAEGQAARAHLVKIGITNPEKVAGALADVVGNLFNRQK